MIVYTKLENLLKDRNMQWKSLCDAGISINMPAKFSKNKPLSEIRSSLIWLIHISNSGLFSVKQQILLTLRENH